MKQLDTFGKETDIITLATGTGIKQKDQLSKKSLEVLLDSI